jgi:hypothetical protein
MSVLENLFFPFFAYLSATPLRLREVDAARAVRPNPRQRLACTICPGPIFGLLSLQRMDQLFFDFSLNIYCGSLFRFVNFSSIRSFISPSEI